MNKNIILMHSVEQYYRKYSNRAYRLVKITKKQVEEYERRNPCMPKGYLLEGRKWALIGDTYYEIPKPITLTWFRNLAIGAQASICLFGTAGVASAVTFPTLSAIGIFNKGGHTPEPGPGPSGKKWYEYDDWYNHTDEATSEDIGVTVKVKVNNQDHLVRLIDIDHDTLADDSGKAHTTFEFANLISDTKGYSLAYQWHDSNDETHNNFDYINSSVRKVLCGNGNYSHDVYCATKDSTTSGTPGWDNNFTYTSSNKKTILSMLPTELSNKIKTVKKTIRLGSLDEYEEPIYTSVGTYTDDLFLLTAKEIGTTIEEEDEGDVYSYYKNHTEDPDSIRSKKQVATSGALEDYIYFDSSETQFQGQVFSYAGFNDSTNNGGDYWLASPCSYLEETPDVSVYCWDIGGDGGQNACYAQFDAIGVAPAFCL